MHCKNVYTFQRLLFKTDLDVCTMKKKALQKNDEAGNAQESDRQKKRTIIFRKGN